jgi:deoxyribose-phosphate aldolase
MSTRIDRILLDAITSPLEIDHLLIETRADTSPIRGIVVPPVFARRVVDALRGNSIRVASVVGYPLGLAKPTVKAIEATSLAKDGVDAVEVTPLSHLILDGAWDALRDELLEMVRGVRAARPTTSIHVRLDLDILRDIDLPGAADAIVRGACDGVVLESKAVERLKSALLAIDATALERKAVIESPADAPGLAAHAVGIRFRRNYAPDKTH